MQCKVTCFTIAVDCSDYDYVCFALLRMSLKVFADYLHKGRGAYNSRTARDT